MSGIDQDIVDPVERCGFVALLGAPNAGKFGKSPIGMHFVCTWDSFGIHFECTCYAL